jgi:hypothetical protein
MGPHCHELARLAVTRKPGQQERMGRPQCPGVPTIKCVRAGLENQTGHVTMTCLASNSFIQSGLRTVTRTACSTTP